jgi:ubiquinone/menaquinone biosynthesis C-methylase UbiE
MNAEHRCACASEEWRATVRDLIMPWVLADLDLGDHLIELGPGFGATTDVLRERVSRVTVVEIDRDLARDLAERLASSNVEVFEGDATALEFPDGYFSAAASLSMLHHVATPALQDRLFTEAGRVLRPGGVLAASDSLDTPELRSFHHDDTFVPIDPDYLSARLRHAGFTDIAIERNEFAWKAVARRQPGS